MVTDPREAVADLPPSAKLVFVVLENHERLTQAAIAEETLLPQRTVRYALEELREADVLHEELNIMDARQRFYSLSADEPDDDDPPVGLASESPASAR
ncbi:MarR family transcriptional regulator [Halobaculum gomorrense]|uniref:Winged helix DNA-binding domain-containing protein n=1 Tax=Halobaculum gomorrense TaxID=43928 RepID=A0A1M5K3F6_9EURY|nr:helix-turn-helix domain-containing protein [Halobaculum gomorrense]SHG46793.1 Winged helix DNA-binding domain-containing protein [Halobaculum gomorrense]